jgi:hypothetical protein
VRVLIAVVPSITLVQFFHHARTHGLFTTRQEPAAAMLPLRMEVAHRPALSPPPPASSKRSASPSVRPPVNRSSAAASICTHRHKLFMFQRKSGEKTIYKTKQPITLPLVPLPFSLSSAFTYFFIVPLLAGSQLQVNPSLSTASCLLGVKKRERERALRAHPISHIQLPLPPYLLFCPSLKLNKFACSLSC